MCDDRLGDVAGRMVWWVSHDVTPMFESSVGIGKTIGPPGSEQSACQIFRQSGLRMHHHPRPVGELVRSTAPDQCRRISATAMRANPARHIHRKVIESNFRIMRVRLVAFVKSPACAAISLRRCGRPLKIQTIFPMIASIPRSIDCSRKWKRTTRTNLHANSSKSDIQNRHRWFFCCNERLRVAE